MGRKRNKNDKSNSSNSHDPNGVLWHLSKYRVPDMNRQSDRRFMFCLLLGICVIVLITTARARELKAKPEKLNMSYQQGLKDGFVCGRAAGI